MQRKQSRNEQNDPIRNDEKFRNLSPDSVREIVEAECTRAERTLRETPCRYGTMLYLNRDQPIGGALEDYGEWAEHELDLLRRFVKPGDVVLDVGANIGTHTLALSGFAGETGSVLAFEPQGLCFTLLAANAALNNCGNVKCINAGVGKEPGTMYIPRARFNEEKYNTGNVSLIAEREADSGEMYPVAVTTLDALKLKSCALIKADVEGMELEVIMGGRKTIERCQPFIYAECISLKKSMRLFQLMLELGYSCRLHTSAAFNPGNFKKCEGNRFGFATETSLFFIPPGHQVTADACPVDGLVEVKDEDEFAAHFLSAPRYGDKTDHDRNPDLLRRDVAEIERLHEALAEKGREIERLDEVLAEKGREVDALSEKTVTLGAVAEALRHKAAKQQRNIDELISVNESLRSSHEEQLSDLSDELRSANAVLVREKATVSSMLNSRSWKITAPLRSLKGKIRTFKESPLSKPLKYAWWLLTFQFQKKRLFLRHMEEAKRLTTSGLFDEDYYTRCWPDVATHGIFPAFHYLAFGAAEGRDPHPLFNTNYYLSRIPPLDASKANPLIHYLEVGFREARDPHPLFSTEYYLRTHKRLISDGANPLLHFLASQPDGVTSPHPLFDVEFYLKSNPDVKKSGGNPLLHFILKGWNEGRNPSEHFDTDAYLRMYEDVRESGVNPLIHYVLYGEAEGRITRAREIRYEDYLGSGNPGREWIANHPVDVIIPVYKGEKETRNCLETVLGSRNKNQARVIIVNDCSPDPQVRKYLSSLQESDNLVVVNNSRNLGFVQSVNIGMSLSTTNDVVLLNSDTEVPEGWLDRLVYHAYQAERVGTVTPFSNNATLCNFPSLKGFSKFLPGQTLQTIDRACFEANAGLSCELPTGVGFCMFIRRDCLKELGLFDHKTFGKGYGEEVDFCIRASVRGWKHLQALDLFVCHAGEVSFENESDRRKKNVEALIQEKYPEFSSRNSLHFLKDPAKEFRIAASGRMLKNAAEPKILFVEHYLGGGVSRHTSDLVKSWMGRAHVLFLRSLPSRRAGVDLELSWGRDDSGFSLELDSGKDLEFLNAFIRSLGVERIHIHHTIGFTPALRRLVHSLSLPFDFTVHDYYGICPAVNLFNCEGQYCGEPGPEECNICIAGGRTAEAADILGWRLKNAWIYSEADRVICPSLDTAERIRRFFPLARVLAAPHEESRYLSSKDVQPPSLEVGAELRIGILGVLANHKGRLLVEKVAHIAAERALSMEFIIIGYSDPPFEPDNGLPVSETGRYKEGDLPNLIEESNLHLVWFPSICPETWSYTLSAAFSAGLPIVAPARGAFEERLQNRSWTWIEEGSASPERFIELFSEAASALRNGQPPPVPCSTRPRSMRIEKRFYEESCLAPGKETAENARAEVFDPPLRVLVIPEGGDKIPSPCAYIRLLQPLSYPSLRSSIDLRMITTQDLPHVSGDVVVTHRTAIRPEEARQFLTLCAERKMPLVYDLDDNLFRLPADHPEADRFRKLHPIMKMLMKASAQVWVSTENLRRAISENADDIKVIPNTLDENIWGARQATCPGEYTGEINILYMGTWSHNADFEIIKPALRKIVGKYNKQVKVEILGVTSDRREEAWFRHVLPDTPAASSYPGFVSWLRANNTYQIGLAPLVDNTFNLSKSGIKFLDYSALGLATVASDVQAYRDVIQNDRTGFLLPNNADAWFEGLCSLIDEPLRLAVIRQRAFESFHADWTLSRHAEARKKMLEELNRRAL